MNKLILALLFLTSIAFAGEIPNYVIPEIKIMSFEHLSEAQQKLFLQYAATTRRLQGEDLWNRSAEVANKGNFQTGLLSQSQLTTFIGVTSMWEASETIALVRSVDEIRDLSDHDGYRLIGTFHDGGGEFIKSNWNKGGISKSEFKHGYREPISGHIRGQFTMTENLKRFNCDVDYHLPAIFWFHGRRENSDIRRSGGLHSHLENHIKKYGTHNLTGEFPIQRTH